ncbi:LPS export ABC transporter periplasmic protein LptC [Psychromonas sp. CD1]|nr:LPS export ABC transporter periplasmic protein LptC [Psychromonas sp. CD1]
MNKRHIIPFALLLIAFLFWSYFKNDPSKKISKVHNPNYIAYNISNVHYDKKGEISYKMFADKSTTFSLEDYTVFINPRVIVYIRNKDTNQISTWQIKSKEGVLIDQNKLQLSDKVRVKNLSLDQLVQNMATEKLTLLLDKKEISSDIFITWDGPQMHQQGIGMWASLLSNELIVKNNIKAVYFNEKN